jgi:hypothetical protein
MDDSLEKQFYEIFCMNGCIMSPNRQDFQQNIYKNHNVGPERVLAAG